MAKLVTTPGKLYLLKERDFLTGEVSPYVKIGLVRNDKETSKRILEHQTGNPREIYDYHTLDVPFVEDLETKLHYIFGEKWIAGEWFFMDDGELIVVLELAKLYIEQQNSLIQIIGQMNRLEVIASNESVVTPSSEQQHLWDELLEVRNKISLENGQQSLLKIKIQQLIGDSAGIEGIASVQKKITAPSFDRNSLLNEQEFASLTQGFYSLTPPSFQSSFLVKNIPTLKLLSTELAEEINKQKKNLPALTIIKDELLPRTSELFDFHLEFIQRNARLVPLEWKQFMLETKLKVQLGENLGLKGICTWKRTIKNAVNEFDVAAFKLKHPELVAQFQTPEKTNFSLIIYPNRAYPSVMI